MRTLLVHLFEKLRSGFWFTPGLITVCGAFLAFLCLWIDGKAGTDGVTTIIPWLKPATADGIRSVLTTIATSVLTIAGVSFSVTSVSFQLASQQFGPRLVRNFVRAPETQSVLGALISTFVFCALVLRATKDGDVENVPQISGLMAMILAILSLGLFIRFIDHTAQSIQADTVIRGVYDDLDSLIERQFPSSRPAPVADPVSDRVCMEASAYETGYVEAIGHDRLIPIAEKHDLQIQLCYRVGDFVHEGDVLVKVSDLRSPDSSPHGDKQRNAIEKSIAKALYIGKSRTPEQDFEFCVQQLVEIALRALSPGINDPITAMSCINYLSAALSKATVRYLPTHALTDQDGTLRLVLDFTDYDGLLGVAFDQLRQAAIGYCDVSCRLLEGLAKIARCAREQSQRDAISLQADLLFVAAEESAGTDREREALKLRYEKVQNELS